MKGIDYSWGRPGGAAIKAAGYKFVLRYLSHDTTGKNLSKAELADLRSHGLLVGVVWESTAARMLGGITAGKADAISAVAQLTDLGMAGAFVYFANDTDTSAAQQPAIHAYLDGAASVIGADRVGLYSGYYPGKRALDAGKAKLLWQTRAWSGGNWDGRAALRQGVFVNVNGVQCDLNDSYTADYGQWPRPVPPKPAPLATYGRVLVALEKNKLAVYGVEKKGTTWTVRAKTHPKIPQTAVGRVAVAVDAQLMDMFLVHTTDGGATWLARP